MFTGEIVQSTSFQGFPVVRSDTDRTVIGFVRKAELRFALDRAKRTRNLSLDATCTFQEISDDAEKANGLLANPDIVITGRVPPTRTRSFIEGAPEPMRRSSTMQSDYVDFGQYVDEVSAVLSANGSILIRGDTFDCFAKNAS